MQVWSGRNQSYFQAGQRLQGGLATTPKLWGRAINPRLEPMEIEPKAIAA